MLFEYLEKDNSMKIVIYTVFSALLLSNAALAGYVSNLQDVGFSNNGKYFAFTTTGDNGMSDMNCRTTTFINTVRNEWVGRPYRSCTFNEAEYGPEESKKMRKRYARARSEVKRLTKKLRINFKNDGQRVIIRGAFRYWKASGSADKEFSKRGESVTFTSPLNNTPYRLRLSKKTVNSAKCEGMMFSHPAAIFSLRMRNLKTKHSTPLQVDRRIPKSRGCPFHYRIQNVYTHTRGRGQVVVALLQYFSPSIEGPDEIFLAVSGRMN